VRTLHIADGAEAAGATGEGPSPPLPTPAESGHRGRLAPADAAVIVLALVPAALGLDWGLPSRERFSLAAGADLEVAIREVLARQAEDEPRKRAGLTFEPLDRAEPDTPGRVLRRFALYSDHPDEMLVLSALSRMRPLELRLDPGAYHYGGLFIYPIGALVWLAGAVGLADVTTDLEVYLREPYRVARLYVIGRLYVLALHAAGLAALFALAKAMLSRRAAHLAVAVYALFPATSAFSHEMKPHLPGATFALLAALVLRRARSWSGWAASGALVGCAMSMTPAYATAALFLPAFAWAGRTLRRELPRVAMGLTCAALAYAALNPCVVARPSRMLEEASYGAAMYPVRLSLLAPVSFLRYLPDALTWPGAAAAAAAAGYLAFLVRSRAGLRRAAPSEPDAPERPAAGGREMLALGAPLAAHLTLVSLFTSASTAGPVNARFGCLAYPFLALVMAAALDELISRDRRSWLAAGALAASLALGSGPYVLAFVRNARAAGTREEAGSFLAATCPAGARIGVRGRLAPWRTPRVALARWSWVDMEREPDAAPPWILAVGGEPVPAGYVPVARFAPAGTGRLFGSPDRMSFASPVFAVYKLAGPPRAPDAGEVRGDTSSCPDIAFACPWPACVVLDRRGAVDVSSR